MADSAAQVAGIAARLRQQGFTVVEVPGWQSRGKGPMTTRGRIEHHTAGPRTGDTPTLRVVTFGHSTLRNSLCRWYVSRSGVIYLVALGVSWHAGVGIKGSNASLSGTEAEHSGRADELWTARSLEAQAAISREECRMFGLDPRTSVWEHREHAPARKVDRAHIDGDAWRRRLTATVQEDDDMTPEQDALLRQMAVDAKYARDKASTAVAALGRIEKQLAGRDVAGDLQATRGLLESIAGGPTWSGSNLNAEIDEIRRNVRPEQETN